MLLKRVEDSADGSYRNYTFECTACQIWYTLGESEGHGPRSDHW